MKLKSILILPILLLPLAACIKGTEKMEDNLESSSKILQLSQNVEEGTFLIKFDQALEANKKADFEKSLGVSLSSVFPSTPGNEELEKQFGLDRWYQAVLEEGESLRPTMLQVAAVPQVQVVEYSHHFELAGDTRLYPVSETKADDTSAPFNDPLLHYQWHYKNNADPSVSPTALAGADINVFPVWQNITGGDPSIVVAVIDEAVKYSHPDLKDNMWVNEDEIPNNGIDDDKNGYIDDVYGYNFTGNNGVLKWDAAKDTGHGTHCAGTIAAVNNNGRGVAGVAGGTGNKDGCRIMSCQIFTNNMGAASSTIAKAVKYAADNGASVISCSFGTDVPFASDNAYLAAGNGIEIDAVHYFEAKKNNSVLNGNIAVFAAGNENHPYAHYPGAWNDIISVSALAPDGLPTYFTNYGPGCNIAAPGGEVYHIINKWNACVLSTVPTEVGSDGINGEYNQKGLEYGYMQGTSQACPHVSGVIALGLSYAKKLGKKYDRDVFKQMVLSSVNDVDQLIARTSEKTYAYHQSPLKMAPYYHQMGTGSIDAWRLMMKIEGTPAETAQLGKNQWIDLTRAFGSASVSLTYLAVDVPEETVNALGLQKIKGTYQKKYPCVPEEEAYAYIQFGRLYIYPTKIGSGKITITVAGGGDHLGGGDNPTGGMELKQDVSLIVRDVNGANGTGGWL